MNIILSYFYWQLIETPKKLILIIKDFIVFGFDLFSVKETSGTYFFRGKGMFGITEEALTLQNTLMFLYLI